MTFDQYQAMPCNQKAEMLWLDGVYLDLIRHTQSLNIELYGLFDFYVEIYFDKKSEEPLFIKAFDHMSGLNPYLSFIDIDGIFQSN